MPSSSPAGRSLAFGGPPSTLNRKLLAGAASKHRDAHANKSSAITGSDQKLLTLTENVIVGKQPLTVEELGDRGRLLDV